MSRGEVLGISGSDHCFRGKSSRFGNRVGDTMSEFNNVSTLGPK